MTEPHCVVALGSVAGVGSPRILYARSLPSLGGWAQSPEGLWDSQGLGPPIPIHAHLETLTGWAVSPIWPPDSDSGTTLAPHLFIGVLPSSGFSEVQTRCPWQSGFTASGKEKGR